MASKYDKALKLFKKGKFEKSYSILEKLTREETGDILGPIYYYMGCCCCLGGMKYKSAVDAFIQSLYHPLSPEGLQYFGLALAYYRLGDAKRASDNLIKAHSFYEKQGFTEDWFIGHESMRELQESLHVKYPNPHESPINQRINTTDRNTKRPPIKFKDSDNDRTYAPIKFKEEAFQDLFFEDITSKNEKHLPETHGTFKNVQPLDWISHNPFYLLGVGMSTPRSEILEASEALMLEADNEDLYQTAANDLINVKRRIEAELHWFPGESDDKIAHLLNSLKTSDNSINILNYSPLTRINYSLSSISEKKSLVSTIIIIDQAFARIDATEIQSEINNARNDAGIPSVESSTIISDGIEVLFSKAVSFIVKLFDEYKIQNLANLMTNLADQTIVRKRYNHFIESLLNNYEIKVESTLSKYKISIQELCTALLDKIKKKQIREDNIPGAVDHIIQVTEEFDVYAQSLQLLAQAKGKKHAISSEIAIFLRNLALVLQNEYHYTDEAIKISDALTHIFAEAADIVARVEDDLETLNEIKNSQNVGNNVEGDLQRVKEILDRIANHIIPKCEVKDETERFIEQMDTMLYQVCAFSENNPSLQEDLLLKSVDLYQMMILALCKNYHATTEALLLSLTAMGEWRSEFPSLETKMDIQAYFVVSLNIMDEAVRRNLSLSSSNATELALILKNNGLLMMPDGRIFTKDPFDTFADRDEYLLSASGFRFRNLDALWRRANAR